MTNGEFLRGLIILKIENLSYDELYNYIFDVEDVTGEFPILSMTQETFEKEVYPNFSEKQMEEVLLSGKYGDDLISWLEREMVSGKFIHKN